MTNEQEVAAYLPLTPLSLSSLSGGLSKSWEPSWGSRIWHKEGVTFPRSHSLEVAKSCTQPQAIPQKPKPSQGFRSHKCEFPHFHLSLLPGLTSAKDSLWGSAHEKPKHCSQDKVTADSLVHDSQTSSRGIRTVSVRC